MKFCINIPKENILNVALKLVGSAKREIVATMDVDEELQTPLPVKYHKAILQKMRKEIKITRFGFGKKKSFNKLARKYSGIQFTYARKFNLYQRMLVVDGKRAMFKLGDQFFYTEFEYLADSLVKYAEIIYNKENL